MKQTIEIDVPDGKKAVWRDNKVMFEDIVPQLPKTWEEFCNTHNRKEDEAYIKSDSKIAILGKEHINIRHHEEDSNLLPSKQAAKQHLTLMKLHQLRDCYRQGWIPDWKDDSVKYIIIRNTCFINERFRIVTYSNTSHFLSFPTYNLAEKFLTNFHYLIEQAGDLI